MITSPSHPLWQQLLAWLVGLPVLALCLHALGRGLLAAAGFGGRAPVTHKRLLAEWLCVLAFVYLYLAYSAVFPHRW